MKTRPISRLTFFSLYLYLFTFVPSSALLPQESRISKEKPSPALIRNLEGQLRQGSPNYAKIEEAAHSALGRYYKQFSEEKSIEYEHQNQRKDYSKLSKNALRLLAQLRERRTGRSYFLGEKPELFRLHVVLAKAYTGSRNHAKALSEYAMAFRYARIEPPSLEEQASLQKLEAELDKQVEKQRATDLEEDQALSQEQSQNQNKITDSQKEASYLQMMKGSFANGEHFALSDTEDSQIQSNARHFAEEFTRYQKLKKEYKRVRGQAALARIKAARGESSSPSRKDAQSRRKAIEQEIAQSKASLEDIRQGAYRSYIEKRREFHGEAAYQMALAVKHLDIARYAFAMQSKQNSYLRGRGEQNSLEEQTLEPSSSALRSLLALAHKINPFHLEYIRLLADENRRSRELKKALFFTRLYVSQAQKQKELPENLSYYTLRLAGLHTEQANYSKAITNYEKYFQLEKSKKQKLKLTKKLADLYYQRSGNTERAKQLYEEYLQGTEKQIEKEPQKQNELRALRCESFKSLAAIARRKQYRKQEKEYLEKAQAEFLAIAKEKEKRETELQALKDRLTVLRKKLRKREDENLQRRYYQLKDKEIVNKQAELHWLKSRLTRLKLPNILEQMAWLSHNRGLWSEAQSLYSIILEKGSQKQIERARQNLERIGLSQEDGVIRPVVPSPDFER